MKKIVLCSLAVLLSACSSNQPVAVATETDHSATTIISQQAIAQSPIPLNLPANATAVCRDGTYSTAKENICAGNGGALTLIDRFHAE